MNFQTLQQSSVKEIKSRKSLFYYGAILTKENRKPVLMD